MLNVELAIIGLIQSISLGGSDITKTLQNTLRLLNLWFKHGGIEKICKIIIQGFDKIDIKVWTDVIPQLLARVDIKN